MSKRNKILKNSHSKTLVLEKIKVHNHLPQNFMLGNKKALFYTMNQYYEALDQETFKYLPLTFHIQDGIDGSEYLKFLKIFYEKSKMAKRC